MEKNKVNFVNENTVYIHGEFDDSIVELLPQIQRIINTQKERKEGKIIFNINSVGGYNSQLMCLINLIENAKKDNIIVETIVNYMAYSCGSMLACSGTTGHRYIAEYAAHLCHYARGSDYSATPTQINRNAENFLRLQNNIKALYKKYCEPTAKKGFVAKLFDNMKDDCFFIPAKQCIEYGLADKIL